MATIAVTDAELRHALNIARALKGDRVTAYGRALFSTAFFSRHVHKRKILKEYPTELKEYDVVFLVKDAAVEFGLEKRLKNALLPKKKEWKIFRDKEKTIRLAEEVGVPAPKTIVIKNFEDDFDYPAFVKPAESSGSRGGRIIHNKQEAGVEIPRLLDQFKKLLVQEVVKKKDTYGVELLYREGELKGLFQHKRLREYPRKGGPSTLRVSIKDKRTKELAERLFSGIEWNGVAMVEFGITKEGPVLFEVNPRWWGSLALAVKAGVNFPRLYRDIIVNGDVKPWLNYKEGVLCKFLLFGDVLHFVEKRDPIGLIRSLGETKNFDILSLRDPLPALVRPLLALEILLRPELKKMYLSR